MSGIEPNHASLIELRKNIIHEVGLHEGWEESAYSLVDEAIMPIIHRYFEGRPAVEGKPLEIMSRDELLAYVRKNESYAGDASTRKDEATNRSKDERDPSLSSPAQERRVDKNQDGSFTAYLKDPSETYDEYKNRVGMSEITGDIEAVKAAHRAFDNAYCAGCTTHAAVTEAINNYRAYSRSPKPVSSNEAKRLKTAIGGLRSIAYGEASTWPNCSSREVAKQALLDCKGEKNVD